MGLRFRKSVKICDGLKLNFGKTGMSVTLGSGPLRKTFNTNGNVTTTVGIPGTGVYWTETERRNQRSNRFSTTSKAQENAHALLHVYQTPVAVTDYFGQTSTVEDDEPVLIGKSSTSA